MVYWLRNDLRVLDNYALHRFTSLYAGSGAPFQAILTFMGQCAFRAMELAGSPQAGAEARVLPQVFFQRRIICAL